MSDGMVGPTVGGEATCVKAAGEPKRPTAAANRQMKWKRGRMSRSLWETHAGNSRLSKCDTPGVLESRPGLERIAPVDSVVQQQPLQKKHVVHSHYGYPTTPNRRNGSDHFRVARISRETRNVGYPEMSISNVFR